MDHLNKPAGILLALLALAVFLNAMAWEFYSNLIPNPGVTWDILNWFMAAGVIIALACQCREKRRLDQANAGSDRVHYSYLATNLLLFATILLTIWFFRNFMANLTHTEVERHFLIWQIVNALFVVVMASTAARLLRRPPTSTAAE